MKNVIMIMLGLFILSACSVVNVSTDYDPKVNLKSYKSFAILSYEDGDSLINNRIEVALARELQSKGYIIVSQDKAEFYVLYRYSATNKSEDRQEFVQTGFGRYGRYGGFYTTSTYHYTEGNFEIRMANPNNKDTFWRAEGTNTLKELDTPKEREKYTNKVVKKMLEKYPKLSEKI